MRVGLFAMTAACALSAGMTPADARPFDTSGNIQWEQSDSDWSEGRRSTRSQRARARRVARAERYDEDRSERSYLGVGSGMRHGGLGPRPRQWCGWWMRTRRGGG